MTTKRTSAYLFLCRSGTIIKTHETKALYTLSCKKKCKYQIKHHTNRVARGINKEFPHSKLDIT